MTKVETLHAAHSIESIGLNLIKGNTLKWRRRAEEEIRRSGVNYTIVPCGALTSGGGNRAVELSQQVFVEALRRSAAERTTFEASWSRRGESEPWNILFSRLQPDSFPAPGP